MLVRDYLGYVQYIFKLAIHSIQRHFASGTRTRTHELVGGLKPRYAIIVNFYFLIVGQA